jgi:Holliday junction resolvase RusA-like endonuclease
MCGQPSYAGPVRVEVRVYRGDARKVDLDNCVKSLTDSLQMVPMKPAKGKRKARAAIESALVNDSQIMEIHAYMSIDREHPRAVVRVEALP